jgi:hypothetical protein
MACALGARSSALFFGSVYFSANLCWWSFSADPRHGLVCKLLPPLGGNIYTPSRAGSRWGGEIYTPRRAVNRPNNLSNIGWCINIRSPSLGGSPRPLPYLWGLPPPDPPLCSGRLRRPDSPKRVRTTGIILTSRNPYRTHGNSAELSHSFKVLERRRNTPKAGQNRSESLCAGLWAPCRVFWAWFGPALGPIPVRNRRFSAGSVKLWGPL